MDLAPPAADAAPSSTPPAPPPPDPPDAILAGVAGLVAARLDVEALWVRIAFVLLALVGGVGVVLYGALWLLLVVGRDPAQQWARFAGGAVLVFGLPLVLTAGFAFFDGPFAVLALLAGLAVALWQPRRPLGAASTFPSPVADPLPPAESEPRPSRWHRTRRPPRPPSILGRLALGVAVLVAAGGALIDQANGARLHPEQWLGAAAIVCGAGLVVGALRGRARWLIVPAALFAGTGFVAGEAARVGVEPTALFGDRYVYVGAETPAGLTQREHVAVGAVDVQIGEPTAAPVTVDARVGVGEVHVSAADDVTVELRASARHGDVRVNGATSGDRATIGPEGRPDVVVIARVGRGDIEVNQYSRTDDGGPPPAGGVDQRYVTDGVAVTGRGQVVLGNGEAVIGADDTVLTGAAVTRNRVTVITTSLGDFQLLPDGLLLTPYGELLDLQAIRGDADAAPSVTRPSIPPITTIAGG